MVLLARARRESDPLARASGRRGRYAPNRNATSTCTNPQGAKRALYAAEAVWPAPGRLTRRFARAAKDLQTCSGRHHDCVELRGVLRQVCAQAEADGESGFAYGQLHALEQARPYHLETQPPAVWTRPSARKELRHSLATGPSSSPPGSDAICGTFWSDMCQRDRGRTARGHRAATSAS